MTQTEKHALWAQEEQSAEMHGWDFSHIRGRVVEAPLPWDYKQKVLDFLKPQSVILDMGTGGGEFLLSLRHPFSQTSVTESWQPNFELCEKKLAPLGITVRKTEEDKPLPFADNSFDLVLNRHDSYDVNEVRRVLKPRSRSAAATTCACALCLAITKPPCRALISKTSCCASKTPALR